MPTQNEALRLMLAAINAMREVGYSQEDVQDLVSDAWNHLEGDGQQPYACCATSGSPSAQLPKPSRSPWPRC